MSDLRPRGVSVEIGGQERKLLFTINAIDEIQEKCNLPLLDAVAFVAKAADGAMDRETLGRFRTIATVLINSEKGENFSEEEIGYIITLENYFKVARAILEAYGISLPDPDEDEDEDDDDEDESPKVETGQ